MYYLYKQGSIPPYPSLAEGVTIQKRRPSAIVQNVQSMQMGRKCYLYFQVMTFLFRGFHRVFEEYDVVVNNRIVSKAVLISKVPIYRFLPYDGVHICYCETIPEAQGRGYYFSLLCYIQNERVEANHYMIVEENNIASIKGIEKAGFVRYAVGKKLPNGVFVES